MAASNRFHRNKPSRRPLPTASCALEGSNTEPEYINALAQSRKLGKRFKIVPTHSDPLSAVRKLAAVKRESEGRGEFRDYWIAVFDTEFTEGRKMSIERARKLAKKKGIICVENTPSFEFWLLLHFSHNDKPYGSQREVEQDLQCHLPEYSKRRNALEGKMRELLSRIDAACENALWIEMNGEHGNNTEMPKMIQIVNEMSNLRDGI